MILIAAVVYYRIHIRLLEKFDILNKFKKRADGKVGSGWMNANCRDLYNTCSLQQISADAHKKTILKKIKFNSVSRIAS